MLGCWLAGRYLCPQVRLISRSCTIFLLTATDRWPTGGLPLTRWLPIHDPLVAYLWPTGGLPMAYRWPTGALPMAHWWPTDGPLAAYRWPTGGLPMAYRWPTGCLQVAHWRLVAIESARTTGQPLRRGSVATVRTIVTSGHQWHKPTIRGVKFMLNN